MRFILLGFIMITYTQAFAQVSLLDEVVISNKTLFFDGVKVDLDHTANSTTGYDYVYGNALTPHGDCIKAYKEFVFTVWYRGGKSDRHVMLTRYNTLTKVAKTIEFPHQHTGYDGKWWIGETHNTIAVGICPKDESVHLLYDMHRNGNVASFGDDHFRYSYSVTGAATVADADFELNKFEDSGSGTYKFNYLPGVDDENTTKLLTYPAFFTNGQGDLFMKMRFGYDKNGKFLFAKYDGNDWEGYTEFNRMGASGFGSDYNWGLYGDLKFLNGKLRIGFQRRSDNRTDKYQYQNGFYYAYSDDPSGVSQWKDYTGEGFSIPLAISDKTLISEPGDLVETTQKDMVHMVSGFDWTVTENDDIHFIGKVKDNENNVTKYVHTYKSVDDAEFTTTTDFGGAEALYAAGSDVYIISLKNSRVNIVKTEGGTSNFQQVYQSTSGPTFDKGVPYVYEGKLYYFLKESGGSGDERTTYLQIYDLDIPDPEPENPNLQVSFENISNYQVIEKGSDLTVEANVGSELVEVSLWHGTTNLGTLTSAPYTWSDHAILTNMRDASYTFKLIAKDASDTEFTKSVTITTPNQWAYTDDEKPHSVPGVIQFEDYDYGGDGIAYYDRSEQSTRAYRGDDLVDLNTDKTLLIYIQGNEWVEYTINVETEGYYEVSVRQTSRREPSISSAFTISFPDENKTLLADVELDYTGSGLFTIQNLGNVFLEKGEHVLRFGFSSYGFDLDYFELALSEATNTKDIHQQSTSVIVYPNPSKTGVFHLSEQAAYKVYSIGGSCVESATNNKVDLSGYPNGIYLLKINGIITKLIKR
ncbi:BNR-4 repeat-containing protein [Saccharicrinis aurantiacus]|uniref:BNR-4 repeat-containing protein n=1 Tax=Saccharicrinis aurantiacus TaxID=1849719 RepID=UPI00249252A1|nr:BNR-4 repeat-containing protein [Saccharicrinis aurantiacus]